VTRPEREDLLKRASAKKMRAARLRAVGDEDAQLEASKFFREAAKDELDALLLVPDASEQEQAGARIEACGLFLEARDPVRATEQWKRIPRWVFMTDTGHALMERLDPVYRQQRDNFAKRWRAVMGTPGATRVAVDELSLDGLDDLTRAYPGVPELWWLLARRSDHRGRDVARDCLQRLETSFAADTDAETVVRRIERTFVETIRIEMKSEDERQPLLLEAVSGIVASFGEMLVSFVEELFEQEIELRPSSASTGSFILDVDVKDLPPHALAALDETLLVVRKPPKAKGHKRSSPPMFDTVVELLTRLQKDGVKLTVTIVPPEQPAQGPQRALVIGAERRRALLEAVDREARANIESIVVPQADDLQRVFRIVEQLCDHREILASDFGITPRQIGYYMHAGRILGLLTESGGVTPAGRLVARLGAEERLRATVVHFESSACGEAWIRWSNGRTLLDVSPDTALDFIVACVPQLSIHTAKRRAQTLMAWYKELIPHHYAQPEDPR
jgi:hypothetical protein